MLKFGIYAFVICRGGTVMCFVLGFGRKRPDLKQYCISGLTFYITRVLMFPLNTVITQYKTYYELMEYANKHILFSARAYSQQECIMPRVWMHRRSMHQLSR